MIDQRERFYVIDKRSHSQPSPVSVGRKRSAERQIGRAGLFLADSPLWLAGDVLLANSSDQLRPLDPGMGSDQPAIWVELQEVAHRARVEVDRIVTELLSTHCVPPTADRDRGFAGIMNGLLEFLD